MSVEQEIAEFEKLKPRLHLLWNALSARQEESYTSVVIPSLTLNQQELASTSPRETAFTTATARRPAFSST
jgi:hypothetical protein